MTSAQCPDRAGLVEADGRGTGERVAELVGDRGGGRWYRNPIWIAIGAIAAIVILLLVVMAARGGGTTVVK